MYQKLGKRAFDVFAAATGLMILLPLFVVVAIVLALHYRNNPFFTQPRIGLGGKPFRIIKFRTIQFDPVSGSPAISRLGIMLRASSMDELPQLLNVLKGDMSLVGPRPLLTHYFQLYRDRDHKRHAVLPGMTGLAQIHGRSALDWNSKFRYDTWYAEHLSAKLDMYILFKTIGVLATPGGSTALHVVFDQFQGFSERLVK